MQDVIPGYTALSVVSDTGEFLIYRVIVNELHKVLIPLRALFAGGKFDQYKRDVPGAASGVEIHLPRAGGGSGTGNIFEFIRSRKRRPA